MRYNKLYGFYHEDTLGIYLDVKFSEIADFGITIECEKKLNTDGLSELWGINSFPTLVLSKNNRRGPIFTGLYPGYSIIEWLNKNGVTRD